VIGIGVASRLGRTMSRAVVVVALSHALLLGCAEDDVVGSDVCVSEGQLGPLALRIDGERAWMIDGTDEIELELLGSGTTSLLRGAEQGSVVAIAQNTDVGATLHAFDRAGVLRYSASFDAVSTTGLGVGSEGLAASTSELLGTGPVGLVATSAGGLSLPAHVPLGGPDEGHVPVAELMGDSVFGQVGWIRLVDESFIPVAVAPIDPYAVRVAINSITLEYTTSQAPGLAFVAAAPGESAVVELPAAFPDTGMADLAARAGNFRLLRAGASPEVFARIDLELGEAELIEPTPPDGWEWFDCTLRNAAIDPEGRVLFELRSAEAARMWAYDVEGDAWTELGLPMSGVEDIEFITSVGDVHVVRGISNGFCPDVEWMAEAPADALIGDSLQIVRREPALAIELPAASEVAPVDAGERCVAVEDAGAWRVLALDGTGETSFAGGGSWIWLD
jgi:hypothetical protein